MKILVDLTELEQLSRVYERETTELAGIAIDLRRRLDGSLVTQLAAYGLPTRGVAYASEHVCDALVAHISELERFTMELERVWAEASGLAREGRLTSSPGTAPDLWWFRDASSATGAESVESYAFADAAEAGASPEAVLMAHPLGSAEGAYALAGSSGNGSNPLMAVIQVASAEVGYVESGGADDNSGNITKYWAELDPSFQGQPWCAAFVSWVFRHANFPLPVMGQWYGYSWTPSAQDYYEPLGRFFPDPQPGDIFIWANQAHTGIVTSGIDGAGNFHTVEGNTSAGDSGSQTNGGGVYARSRNLSQVVGFCRPEYPASGTV